MSKESTASCTPQEAAVDDLRERYSQALTWFCRESQPQWERTYQAMRCFAKLPLDPLPKIWQRRIDITFRRVNSVLAGYSIKTEQDYQQISAEDLQKIMGLVLGLPTAR